MGVKKLSEFVWLDIAVVPRANLDRFFFPNERKLADLKSELNAAPEPLALGFNHVFVDDFVV